MSLSADRQRCRLSRPGVVCSLGDDLDTIAGALFNGQRGLTTSAAFTPERDLPLGMVTCALPDWHDWPPEQRSRNNRLLALAMQRLHDTLMTLRESVAPERIGVVIGTSTSGIGETEHAIAQAGREGPLPETFRYANQELGAPAHFVADRLGARGPVYALSTACSSSARALASARRLLASGTCDAVVAGGADSLCRLTVNGFASLEAISERPCLPFSAHRDGINIGEAAALFVVTEEDGGIQLAGVGESSDAYHISAPRPDGSGAHEAMRQALAMGGYAPEAVDYLNLHGTGTPHNDSMEARAVTALFETPPPCSSTKGLTGHTLGAAGALEAAFCWLALTHQQWPVHVFDGHPDPELPCLDLVASARAAGRMRSALSNSFAFGGNNAALLMTREEY
ncbi:3-oxoacyl-[acyl-carrier-protein] synthase-1 [Chromohalobacter marismortui]|uniref:3-oxoacyl-[acyl-carrier-protein] synthase-1 n=1 Tax=Chromohalobacter marismortui TaxID=42055 RepID=A0A4R7NM26_9GAMM|nr:MULTISPECIES: beta-ketoacyl-ACP synthase [Chromohalobacter]MCI0510240.1 beta-ketoacyl-ACP synthase [Chromohalobacter sp.]MCI0593416.1 beta-ketoacyl-ACP synthase [Chromohalobacter sp.]TDU21658.1 3-oxoacyl-[acyl-carrier-protein] synthase-1 [Chromohalobacter marismortui]